MWLFSESGFVSIVQDRLHLGQLLVRARVRQDLEHFLVTVQESAGVQCTVKETQDADYRYRASVEQSAVAKAVAKMVEDIDYPNFKAAVHGDMKRDAAYLRVWSAMHDLQEFQTESKQGNQLLVISPYIDDEIGLWVFDDPRVGLIQEPFVSGSGEFLDFLVKEIPNARQGFRLFFSALPFVGWQFQLARKDEEAGGYWYELDEPSMEGWLCPAMFKYFTSAPARLYVRAEARDS